MHTMRLSFWLMISVAITVLFMGPQPSIMVRMQHNWISSLVLLALSVSYRHLGLKDGHTIKRSISMATRVYMRVTSVILVLFGVSSEIFAHTFNQYLVDSVSVICAFAAAFCMYFSFSISKDDNNNQ